MLNLLELKNALLQKLQTLNEQSFSEQTLKKIKANEFICFDSEIEKVDLIDLVTHSQCYPLSYFRSKDQNKTTYLGLGANQIFTSKFEYNKMLDIVEKWPDITLLGGQRFFTEQKPSKEWKDFSQCTYVLPVICFIDNGDKTIARLQFPKKILKDQREKAKFSFALDHALTFKEESHKYFDFINDTETPSKETWYNVIQTCLQSFEQTPLNKVVMARKKVFTLKEYTGFKGLINKLKNTEHYFFFLALNQDQSFISVTPEKLFKIEGYKLSIDSLAGTRPRGKDKIEDDILANELVNSQKEITEHRFVTDEIQNKLNELGIFPEIQKKEGVLKLKFVQHIHTLITGLVTKKDNFAVMINTFHPTPAVGGLPSKEAHELIQKLEPFDRGFYAAPVGYINGHGSEFAVAIRSALLKEDQLHLFGGAGIVKGSDPEKEWQETGIKMNNFLTLFGPEL